MLLNFTLWVFPSSDLLLNLHPEKATYIPSWQLHELFTQCLRLHYSSSSLNYLWQICLSESTAGVAVCRRNTDETMRLQPKIGRFKIHFKACKTCKHVNAEKRHGWEELSQRRFHHRLVSNANVESFLGTCTNIIDLWWNLHFPVVLPAEIWPPHLFCC